jgi:hypothetical protein
MRNFDTKAASSRCSSIGRLATDFSRRGWLALVILALAAPPGVQAGGLFEGLLDVVKGAFRFTTTLLSRAHRRRVDVRIANVTAGIRGTDV